MRGCGGVVCESGDSRWARDARLGCDSVSEVAGRWKAVCKISVRNRSHRDAVYLVEDAAGEGVTRMAFPGPG